MKETIQLDIDLETILENQAAKEQMAQDNNVSVEDLESIFRDALRQGITTINQLNNSLKGE